MRLAALLAVCLLALLALVAAAGKQQAAAAWREVHGVAGRVLLQQQADDQVAAEQHRRLLQEGSEAAAARARLIAQEAAALEQAAQKSAAAAAAESERVEQQAQQQPDQRQEGVLDPAAAAGAGASGEQDAASNSAERVAAAELAVLQRHQVVQAHIAARARQYQAPVHVRSKVSALLGREPEQAPQAAAQLYHPPMSLDGVTLGRVDEWPLVTPAFQEAYHECTGKTLKHRVCKLHNVLLWNGTLYYPTTDEQVLRRGPPKVPLSWVPLKGFGNKVLGQNNWLEVLHPSELPFDWHRRPRLSIPQALLWELTFHDNYGHMLGEHGPMIHTVLCAYLGRCSYTDQDLDGLHILLTNFREDMIQIMPAAVHEMFGCFSKKSVMQVNDAFFEGHVVVIGSLLAGIGPTCRGYPWCRSFYGRDSIPPAMVTSWQDRLLQCVGLPTHTVSPIEQPNIVIVNRPYDAGRGFLNLYEVAAHVQLNFPQANVTTHMLEGKSLAEQAAIYYNSSIVIQTHGAALGNMVFMPRGSVVIDIVPANNDDKTPWVMFMASDYRPLYILPIALPQQKTVLMMHKVRRSKEWAMMTPYTRLSLLRTGTCPQYTEVYWQFDPYAACNFQWYLKYANIVLNPDEVVAGLHQAIAHIRSQHSFHNVPGAGHYFRQWHPLELTEGWIPPP